MKADRFVRAFLPPLVPAIAALAGTEIAVRLSWVPAFLVPAPSMLFASILRDWPELWRATLDTSGAALLGFGMSIAAGSVIAVLLSSAAWIQRAFYPYAVFFQTVPIIAIAPLLVI